MYLPRSRRSIVGTQPCASSILRSPTCRRRPLRAERSSASAKYAPSNRNKGYALAATALLEAGTHRTITALWAEVSREQGSDEAEPIEVPHNGQMDVVLALWKNGLIVPKSA
jgi:hypothetical protein